MKKLMIVLLSVFSLFGCTTKTTTENGDYESFKQDSLSQEQDIQTKDVSEKGWGLTLDVKFTSEKEFDIIFNHSSENAEVIGEMMTGAAYFIRILHNGEYIDLGEYRRDVLKQEFVDDFAWNMMAYHIFANDITVQSYNLEYTYGELEPGDYAVVKDVTISTENGETGRKEVLGYFKIED